MWLQKIVYFLIPTLKIQETPWHGEWERVKRQEFVLTMRLLFAIGILTYLFHYFIIDERLGLTNDPIWFYYRIGMSFFCLLILILYFIPPVYEGQFYWLIGYMAIMVVCYWQGKTMVWYSGVHFLYTLIIDFIGVILLRATVLTSLLYFITVVAFQYNQFILAHTNTIHLMSIITICTASIIFIRSRMSVEIDHFLTNKKFIDTQKKLIELDLELHEQVKSFLPQVVYQRIVFHIKNNKRSVVDAIDETLRPRKIPVACLWSDIRSFTQGSKELDQFVLQSALPNIKSMTNLLERCGGIPRLIGDLVFGYFDEPHAQINIVRAVIAGCLLIELNQKMNEKIENGSQIRRFILLSAGEAIVGNIGGEDSSRDITALGSPVNILSRIDSLTKDEALRSHLKSDFLILTSYIGNEIQKIDTHIRMDQLDLKQLGITIRDFPEEDYLYLMPIDGNGNKEIFVKWLDQYLP